MRRILSTLVEVAAAAIPLTPLLLACNARYFHSGKRTAVYLLFALYLAAVCALVGLPNICYVRLDLHLNLIPFRGLGNDLKNFCLNIMLFIPLGIFLPCLWRRYRSLEKTALHGLCVSAVVEILQIFTFRATDVDDLLSNVMGTVLGFFIGKALIRLFQIPGREDKDLRVLYILVLAVAFFIQPVLSNVIWGQIL